MARGQTWSEEEVKTLIQIWSDENVSQLLVTMHKNNEVFKLISAKMEKLGFPRTVAQCRTKVKKLRQQYVKTRDVRRKSGSSEDTKDKFLWYDELDAVLGPPRPTSNLESHREEPPPPSSLAPSDSESTEQDQDSENSDKSATDLEAEETPTTSSLLDGERGQPKLAVPGAQKRKKKTLKADRFEKMFESYLDEKRKMDEDECKRMKQESASFENFLKMQQQAVERRFQLMQEQQRANSQMFCQMMSNFLHAAVPRSMTNPNPTTQQWTPPSPVSPPLWPTASSHHQHNIPTTHHPAPAQPPQEPTSQHSTSPVGGDSKDFNDL